MRLDNGTQYRVLGNASGQRMRLRYAREKGFRACAAEHAWSLLTFPLAPYLFHTGRGRGNVGAGEKER
jgi:hypothetical protein